MKNIIEKIDIEQKKEETYKKINKTFDIFLETDRPDFLTIAEHYLNGYIHALFMHDIIDTKEETQFNLLLIEKVKIKREELQKKELLK